MAWNNINTNSERRLPARLGAGLVLSAMFASGAFVGAANADGRWDGHRDHYRSWNGGYYRAPPVVYGSPYASSYYGRPTYYPPPIVYGPGVGLNIQIR
jgi:hypothetical protein